MLLAILVALVALPTIAFKVLRLLLRRDYMNRRLHTLSILRPEDGRHSTCIVGFFHPYADAGGGGERVLWAAIEAIQAKMPHCVCVIYMGGPKREKTELLRHVRTRFGIEIEEETVGFEFLTTRSWLEASKYPRFTLLGQSFGSLIVAWEALSLLVPDIFVDTTGYAFTYPLAKAVGGCRVLAYVHYPTISTDMLNAVSSRSSSYNNSPDIASSPTLTSGKKMYYQAFATVYRWVGWFADRAVVNSSWTKAHIDSLWATNASVLYPPCDTTFLSSLTLEDREPFVVSVAQFRPEKNHALQIRAFHKACEHDPKATEDARLVLVGSVRGTEDQARVRELEDLAKSLGIEKRVQIIVNAGYEEVVQRLRLSRVGLHTMCNEHFGIGVVELMAAGLITIAHNSGGPKEDIITSYKGGPTGLLAETEEEFSSAILKALTLPEEERKEMIARARARVGEFSGSAFQRDWVRYLGPYMFA